MNRKDFTTFLKDFKDKQDMKSKVEYMADSDMSLFTDGQWDKIIKSLGDSSIPLFIKEINVYTSKEKR